MAHKLKGRVALITGSGQGIVRAIALTMAREGARVVTNSRKPGTPGGDAETTAATIRQSGGEAIACFADISQFEEARQLIATAVKSFGRLDILVNNAGQATDNHVWDMTEEEWDPVIAVSLKGTFNCTRHALNVMIRQAWGRIVNTTSIAWLGTAERCSYNAAKAGVVGLTRGVAKEVGSYGITCNAYVPRAATRLSAGPEALAVYRRRYEAGFYSEAQYQVQLNLPEPDTVPALPVYLCTDEAANINGKVFYICGNQVGIYSEPALETIISPSGSWTVDELVKQVPQRLLEK